MASNPDLSKRPNSRRSDFSRRARGCLVLVRKDVGKRYRARQGRGDNREPNQESTNPLPSLLRPRPPVGFRKRDICGISRSKRGFSARDSDSVRNCLPPMDLQVDMGASG